MRDEGILKEGRLIVLLLLLLFVRSGIIKHLVIFYTLERQRKSFTVERFGLLSHFTRANNIKRIFSWLLVWKSRKKIKYSSYTIGIGT